MALSISHRCLNIAPSLTLQIDTRAKEMAAAGVNVIGFGAGEPDFPTPPHICEAAKEALDMGMTRYTPVPGTMELRMAITRKMERDHGLTYSPQEILVSNGAKHSIHNALFATLNPGDEAILPAPCWVSYTELIKLCGAVPKIVATQEQDSFKLTPEAFRAAITPKTRMLLLCNPSNPTGSCYTKSELVELAKIAVENGLFVVADEIYEQRGKQDVRDDRLAYRVASRAGERREEDRESSESGDVESLLDQPVRGARRAQRGSGVRGGDARGIREAPRLRRRANRRDSRHDRAQDGRRVLRLL